MHTSQILAAIFAISSVQAIGMPSLLTAALSRRQDPAPVPAPSLAAPVPSSAVPVPAPDSAVPAVPVSAPDAPIPAPAVPAPPQDSAVPPPAAPAPPPAAPADSPAPSPNAAAASADGLIGADPAIGPEADTKRKPKPLKGGEKGECPPVWNKISKELTRMFLEDGQCNDLARGAIRAAFHDCGAYELSLGNKGGCDGSLFLAKEELERQENAGLREIVPMLGKMAKKFEVGMGDFFQFAGAHAVKTCPLGPTVQVFVGRKDSAKANPAGLIPNPRSPGGELVKLFEAKGISPPELAALIGAHTASKQREFDPAQAGKALDSTVGIWDVKFYMQVLKKSAPFILPSDAALAKNPATGPAFKAFAESQGGWSAAFSPAMTHLGLLGVERAGLIDCTAALPQGALKRHAAPAKRSWWQNAW